MRVVYRAAAATVFYDFDYEEFVVKFCFGPDYRTDDRTDAIETAITFEKDFV